MPVLVLTAHAQVEHKGKLWFPQRSSVRDLLHGYDFHDPTLREMAEIAHAQGAFMALTYLSATTANNMLNQIVTSGLYMGINNSTGPSTSGANEIAYNSSTGYTQSTRPSITWGSQSNGVQSSSNTQTFTMGGSWTPGAIAYFSIWGASTSGTYYAGGTTSGLSGNIPAAANVTFTSALTLTVAG